MNTDEKRESARQLRIINEVWSYGFRPLGDWRFQKNGKVYDLSAADLRQLERIEREGLFLV